MRDHYRILEDPLGQGAFGEVRRCVYLKLFQDIQQEEDDAEASMNDSANVSAGELEPVRGTEKAKSGRQSKGEEDLKDAPKIDYGQSFFKQYRAVKVLSKNHMTSSGYEKFYSEVDAMLHLSGEAGSEISHGHPSIIKMFHYYEDVNRFYLVSELCEGGDIFAFIDQKRKLEINEAAMILK